MHDHASRISSLLNVFFAISKEPLISVLPFILPLRIIFLPIQMPTGMDALTPDAPFLGFAYFLETI
jgi:hypothetical protein